MDAGSVFTKSLTVAMVAVVGLLVLGAMLGQPVLRSYVETGSIAPTLEHGHGFVAVPGASSWVEQATPVAMPRREKISTLSRCCRRLHLRW